MSSYDKIIVMKDFFRVLYTIFKIVFCFLITFILGMQFLEVAIRPILGYDNWDFQIIFYLLFTLLALFVLWVVLFRKSNIAVKFLSIILLIFHFQLPHLLPSVMYQFKQASCLEDGICFEGAEVYRKGQKIIINKENCLKYGWKWDEKRKWCDLND